MSKISNTGSGSPRPIGGPDSTENPKETSTAKETTQTGATAADSESASAKQVTGDKYAAGDLKALGDRAKLNLDSELQKQEKELKNKGLSPEQLAAELAKGQVRFAPPYVPVGPVVMGDDIPVPSAGETTQMNLRPDQFQINDKGNLVITNEKLIEFFKSLKENATGQEILLGITKMKTPGEE